MKKKLVFQVTKADITAAKAARKFGEILGIDSREVARFLCPVATAVRRKFKDKEVTVVVDEGLIQVVPVHYYNLSKELVRFIDDFDAGKSVKPQRFVVREE